MGRFLLLCTSPLFLFVKTEAGKASMANLSDLPPRELAVRAAMERLGNGKSGNKGVSDDSDDSSSSPKDDSKTVELTASGEEDEDDGIEDIKDHAVSCACRACSWDKMVCSEIVSSIRDWN